MIVIQLLPEYDKKDNRYTKYCQKYHKKENKSEIIIVYNFWSDTGNEARN